MCPTMEMWGLVAFNGQFLLRVESVWLSQAFLIVGERVLPGRSITANAFANSASVTISRLSATPGSTISKRFFFEFHFWISSRTSLMRPSPDDRPPFIRSSIQC